MGISLARGRASQFFIMALVRLSIILDSIKGKAGNAVFQGGPGSTRVRQKVSPANPKSAAQTSQRALVTSISKAWAGLTETQRTGWNTAAASGNWTLTDAVGGTFNPSGQQLYMQLNLNLELAGQSQISDAPAKASFPTLSIGALTMTAGTPAMSLAFTGTLGSGKTLIVSGCAQQSTGVMSVKSTSLRFVQRATGTSPINMLSAYTAKFGSLVAGQKVFVKLEIVDDASGEKVAVGTVSGIVGA